MKKNLIVLFVVTMALLAQPFFAFSQAVSANDSEESAKIEELNRQIAAKRKKIQEIESSIEQTKKSIDKKKSEAVSLKNQIAILDNRATQINLDIEATQEKLDTLELEIESLGLEIGLKEKSIIKQKEILAEFIRTLSYENDKSYLEVLAAYNNFSEFYNRLQYLQTIQEDMGKSAKSLRLAKVELEEEKTNTEERKNSYEKLKEDLDQKMKDYGEQIMGKQELLIQTKSSENAFQTLLSNLKKQNEEIQQEISNVESEVRKRLEGQDKLNQLENGNYGGLFSWPTQSRYITSYFHDPDYPYRYVFEHTGIDIRAGQGTAVKAAASGYVGRAKRCSSSWCYSYVMLIHANGLATVYGHLNIVSVPEDKFIARGDVIGYSGGTPGTLGAGPFVTGPHLHFEVRKNGIPVNPLDYMLKDWE